LPIFLTFLISHLVLFRDSEILPPAGLAKGMVDWVSNARLGKFRLILLANRVLLDWIVGLLNPDCNPIWWIGL